MADNNLSLQHERAAAVIQEYRKDLANILELSLRRFVNHATGQLPGPYCVLTDRQQAWVKEKTATFIDEMHAFLKQAEAVPMWHDLPQRPQDVDVSGILEGLSKGARS